MGTLNLRSALLVALAISAACGMILLLALQHQARPFMSSQRKLCKDVQIIDDANPFSGSNVVTVAALVQDASSLHPRAVEFLVQITCKLQAPVHVVVANGKDTLHRAYHEIVTDCGVGDFCADFTVVDEDPDIMDAFPNRIDRLAFIREQQRADLTYLHLQGGDNLAGDLADNDFVIVVDLDLKAMPFIGNIEATLEALVTEHTNLDIVCANGMVSWDEAYGVTYDTYATILDSDTWLYGFGLDLDFDPDNEKKYSKKMMEFDLHVAEGGVRHDKKKEARMFPVKTCFGGLAIYRAKVWFDADCHYDDKVDAETNSHLLKYRSIDDERVCEHVVFQDCLEKHRADLQVSIDTNLITQYHDDESFIAISGKAFRGLQGCKTTELGVFKQNCP